jgi:hypothetical protein
MAAPKAPSAPEAEESAEIAESNRLRPKNASFLKVSFMVPPLSFY